MFFLIIENMKKIYFENFLILEASEIDKLVGYKNFRIIRTNYFRNDRYYSICSNNIYGSNSFYDIILEIEYISNTGKRTIKQFYPNEKILFTGNDLLSLSDYYCYGNKISSVIMNTE